MTKPSFIRARRSRVKIEASGAALTGAMIAAEDPIKAGQVLSRPPYRFSITIPAKTTPGLYTLVAEGASPTSDIPSSEPISIDVERLDSPQSIATDVTHLDLKVGEQSAIDVTGTYPDGSHVRLTKSTQTNYETVPAGVVSVTRDGLVTALAAWLRHYCSSPSGPPSRRKSRGDSAIDRKGSSMRSLMVKVTNVALLRLALQTLVASSALLQAQSVLQITSPTNGTVVKSWQTILVDVSSSVQSLTGVMVATQDPIITSQVLTAPPYQFSITVPTQIAPGLYTLVAEAASASSDIPSSGPVSIDVERADSPQSVTTDVLPDRTASGWAGGYRAYRDLMQTGLLSTSASPLKRRMCPNLLESLR